MFVVYFASHPVRSLFALRYHYSYISSAAVKIGEDVLEVAGWGDYFVGGVGSASLPTQLGPFEVTHQAKSSKDHIFRVQISAVEALLIKTFKDLVSIHIEGASFSRFGSGVGLLGNFSNGVLVGRDGVTNMERDVKAFGQEWQVRDTEPMLFTIPRKPQYPTKCILPDDDTTVSGRRLGETLAQENAEKACAHFSGDSHSVCVFDVLATGDQELAGAGFY